MSLAQPAPSPIAWHELLPDRYEGDCKDSLRYELEAGLRTVTSAAQRAARGGREHQAAELATVAAELAELIAELAGLGRPGRRVVWTVAGCEVPAMVLAVRPSLVRVGGLVFDLADPETGEVLVHAVPDYEVTQ